MRGARSGKTYRLRGDGPLWTIPTAELFDNPEYQQIVSRVRDKFLLTIGLDSRYALVTYTLAYLNAVGNEERVLGTGYDAEALLGKCLRFWSKTAEAPSRAVFEALLDEMFGLGVLGRFRTERTTRYRYCLASRQVATMLGSEDDIVHTLGELAETEPSSAAILAATGGIPSEITGLVREARFADDRDAPIARWKPVFDKVTAATAGAADDRFWKVFLLVESDPKPEDYLAMNDLIRDATGADLVNIGPDLVAMGLVIGWNHAVHRIQRSALSDLLARQQAV